eukprot:SAG31_NODE_480_length_15108_cov_56.073423_1_plen_128_part_00
MVPSKATGGRAGAHPVSYVSATAGHVAHVGWSCAQAVLAPPGTGTAMLQAEHWLCLALGCYAGIAAYRLGPRAAYKAIAGGAFAALSVVPGVSSLVDVALADELATIEQELLGDGDPDAYSVIPEAG